MFRTKEGKNESKDLSKYPSLFLSSIKPPQMFATKRKVSSVTRLWINEEKKGRGMRGGGEDEREERNHLNFSLSLLFSRRRVEPALDESAPLCRGHAGLAPCARVGVEDALLDGLVDLLGGLEVFESVCERVREREQEKEG